MAFNESMITVVGRLGGDGEFRQLEGDKCVVNARVAATVKLGKKEVTNWFSFSLWDGFAKAVGTKLFKGDLVYVRGPLVLEEYEKKDGGKGAKLVIYPDSVILLGKGTGPSVAPDGELDPHPPTPRGGAVPSPFAGRR